jgi:hypothetical protein
MRAQSVQKSQSADFSPRTIWDAAKQLAKSALLRHEGCMFASRQSASSRPAGEAGETMRYRQLFMLVLCVVGCESEVGGDAPTIQGDSFPTPFFPGVTTVPASATVVPRSSQTASETPCATDADLGLRADAIVNAPGRFTYAWLGEEQTRQLAKPELPLPAPTAEFEARVRALVGVDIDVLLEDVIEQATGALTTWPAFWATRLETPVAAPYLVRLAVRPEALWITRSNGQVLLVDYQGNSVPVGATEEHANIVGVFFASHTSDSSDCASPFARRELVITNPAMIEYWDVGSAQVGERVESTLQALATFGQTLRSCVFPPSVDQWSRSVACDQSDPPPLWSDYGRGLALVDERYYPNARNVARLTDILAADWKRWGEHPLSVTGPASWDASSPDAGFFGPDVGACANGIDGGPCYPPARIDAGSLPGDSPSDGGTPPDSVDASGDGASGRMDARVISTTDAGGTP